VNSPQEPNRTTSAEVVPIRRQLAEELELDDDELEGLEDDAAFVRDAVAALVRRFGAAEVVKAAGEACAELSTDCDQDARDDELDALERAAAEGAKEIYLALSFNLEAAATKAAELEQKLEAES